MPEDDSSDLEIFHRLSHEAYKRWGFPGQANAMIQEMAELTQELTRYANEEATAEDIYEEMVGVRSVLDSLEYWVIDELHHETLQRINAEQQEALARRLREDGMPVDKPSRSVTTHE